MAHCVCPSVAAIIPSCHRTASSTRPVSPLILALSKLLGCSSACEIIVSQYVSAAVLIDAISSPVWLLALLLKFQLLRRDKVALDVAVEVEAEIEAIRGAVMLDEGAEGERW